MDLDTAASRYVHPDDEPFMTPARTEGLALHLLPLPVNGNLRHAEVLILMLNSGFGESDVLWEKAHPSEHRAMLASQRTNVHQSHTPDDYHPFYDLNPLFCDHPGAGYWKGGANLATAKRQAKKLASVITELAHTWRVSTDVVDLTIASRVAVVELLAYRSTSFNHRGLFKKLPSCAEALALVGSLVAENEKLVVVPRSVKEWGFSGPENNSENLVVYGANQGLSASLTTNSVGGQALLKRLLVRRPEAT